MSTAASVGIYRQAYLPISETFILDHINTLSSFVPIPICEQRCHPGLSAPRHSVQELLGKGAVRRRVETALLTRFGRSSALDAIGRKHRLELLHAHFLTDGTRVMRYAARRSLPLVVTAHGYDATIYDEVWQASRAGRSFIKERGKLFEHATVILCVSEFIRDELLRRGAPADKLLVRRLGINLAEFEPGAPPGTRSGALFVGRLVPKKGVLRLVEAWKLLPENIRRQKLTIIGAGEQEAQLRAACDGHQDIVLLGAQPREAVRQAMRRNRVLALPSMRAANGDSEGLPIVAMEAQASRTPLLVFDDGPMREAVADGRSGLYVPPGDIPAYARALKAILGDDELANGLGAGGVDGAARSFDLKRNTAAIEDVYRDILQTSAGAVTARA
jgi:glycosyltransferase involved in cell wall biosynthesis